MKKFYLFNRGKQEGPYSIAELQDKGLKLSTLVWHKGIPGWQYAGVIPELQALFFSTNEQGTLVLEPPPKNTPIPKRALIIALVILVAIATFLTYSYFSSFDIKP